MPSEYAVAVLELGRRQQRLDELIGERRQHKAIEATEQVDAEIAKAEASVKEQAAKVDEIRLSLGRAHSDRMERRG